MLFLDFLTNTAKVGGKKLVFLHLLGKNKLDESRSCALLLNVQEVVHDLILQMKKEFHVLTNITLAID